MRFLSVFGTFSHKVVKTFLVCHETWHTTLFGVKYVLKLLELKTLVICLILCARLRFWGFLAFIILYRIKWFQLGFFTTKYVTQHYLEYIILSKSLELKTIAICLLLSAKLRFLGFVSFLALSHIKWFKLGMFATKIGTQHYLVYIILLKWLETKTILMWLILRAMLRFWGFLSVFRTLLHQVVKTWFFLQQQMAHNTIWHILLCWNV